MDYRDNPQHRVLLHSKWCTFTPANWRIFTPALTSQMTRSNGRGNTSCSNRSRLGIGGGRYFPEPQVAQNMLHDFEDNPIILTNENFQIVDFV